MDKKKITDLARACSLACKELVKDAQFARKLPAPAVTLIALTVFNNVLADEIVKKGWAR